MITVTSFDVLLFLQSINMVSSSMCQMPTIFCSSTRQVHWSAFAFNLCQRCEFNFRWSRFVTLVKRNCSVFLIWWIYKPVSRVIKAVWPVLPIPAKHFIVRCGDFCDTSRLYWGSGIYKACCDWQSQAISCILSAQPITIYHTSHEHYLEAEDRKELVTNYLCSTDTPSIFSHYEETLTSLLCISVSHFLLCLQ